MKRTILSFIAVAIASLGLSAQTITDAKPYFTGNPYGWATVSDEAGTPYQMDGGMRAAKPKTIVLTSTGKDMYDAVISAINQYDIIVFDGSKGDFILRGQVPVNNAKNKTIVGRNNARLCTEFFLTPEDITYLKSQKLDGLSSTDQYTGTLPNGQEMTCDRRAFFTKKAMMELQYQKKGVYSLPNNAGIFGLKATDENIIFRNLTFVGPGAVDIDGVDLITNEEATHVWVDHCTFIDSQDGALDSKRCDYASYTWNKFYYTERSYSHAYTNGCGWAEGNMTLHLTFANNEWGKGCNRRLPQCGDCYVHLFNNYHNCPGNSVGMTINDNCTALVEGNFAATGVNSPLTGSGSGRKVYARKNNFAYTSTSTSVTVPYGYDVELIDCYSVPQIMRAAHGAGATLENPMPGTELTKEEGFGFWESTLSLPKGNQGLASVKNLIGVNCTLSSSNPSVVTVDAEGKVTAVAGGTAEITATVTDDPIYGTFKATMTVTVTEEATYEVYKKWDFKRSAETTAALDASDWSASGDVYTWGETLTNQPLMIDDSTPFAEAAGLLFSSPAEKLQSYKDRLRFNKENSSDVTIPDLKAGDKVFIKFKSANSTSMRGFNTTNLSDSQILTDGNVITHESSVLADGDVKLVVTGGLYLYFIEVQRMSTATAIQSVNASAKSEGSIFNLAGQRVNGNAKGIVIKNGKKMFAN